MTSRYISRQDNPVRELDHRFHETDPLLGDSSRTRRGVTSFVIRGTRLRIMTARRRVVELAIADEDLSRLMAIARSRMEPASRVERARMLLAYRDDPSFFAVGQALGVHHQTVQRCIARAVAYGPMVALADRPRPGREPTITADAKAGLIALACRKAKELGYPHELWTTRLLARHAREHGPAAGHGCLAQLVQGTVCKILNEQEVKPHKVRYYLKPCLSGFYPHPQDVGCFQAPE